MFYGYQMAECAINIAEFDQSLKSSNDEISLFLISHLLRPGLLGKIIGKNLAYLANAICSLSVTDGSLLDYDRKRIASRAKI